MAITPCDEKEEIMKYKLDIKRDVDPTDDGFMLYLPFGFRFYDEIVHCRGYDTMAEMRKSIKEEVIVCECEECLTHK